MPGLAPQGPHASIGVSIQPTASELGQAWVRYTGECAALGGAIIAFDSTVSEEAAQAIEFAVSQLEHRILPDFSRPVVRSRAPRLPIALPRSWSWCWPPEPSQ